MSWIANAIINSIAGESGTRRRFASRRSVRAPAFVHFFRRRRRDDLPLPPLLCAGLLVTALLIALWPGLLPTARAQVPLAIHAPGAAIAAIFHAEGLQLYECSPASDRALTWQSREPIATLVFEGNTVGRHYTGPDWEHVDGSAVRAKAVGSTPGKTLHDLPWLKLDVVSRRGKGTLSGVTVVQRVNTQGGVAQGPCDEPGSFHAVPYSADYVFLRTD
jgi:hypothetical protein